MADAPTLELRIQSDSDKAIQSLQALGASLDALKKKLSGANDTGFIAKIGQLGQSLKTAFTSELAANIDKTAAALERIAGIKGLKNDIKTAAPEIAPELEPMKPQESGVGYIGQETAEIKAQTDAIKDNLNARSSGIEIAEQETAAYKDALRVQNEAIASERVAQKIKSAQDKLGGPASGAAKSMKETKKSAFDLGKTFDRVLSPLSKVIRAFNRILFYRVIRNVLKHIGEGFKEGIENVRAYSKAINGTFNTAMTNMENSLFKMKNSLGAALAPALEAVIPYVRQLVSWFITLINYVNQFIALMTGKSQWTRATDASAASFEKTKKAASGAAKEVKNLLAGFDELNIIQSESGSGGGAGGAASEIDYSKAFEEVYEFDEKIRDLVKKAKDAIEWVKENLDLVKQVAIDIGAAILAWRLSKSFSGVLGKLFGLVAAGAVIKLVFDMVSYFDNKYLETGDKGWLVANVLTTAIGALATKAIIDQVLKNRWGTVAAGVTLMFSAGADIKALLEHTDVSALSEESVALSIIAAMKMGVAGYMIAKFFSKNIPKSLMIGGGVALVTFGAAVGIKAIANAVATDNFTEEYLRATATASVSMGLGSGLAMYSATGNLKGSIGLGGGVALATFGVMTGVQAVHHAVKAGYDKDFYIGLAKASLALGAGSALAMLALGMPAGIVGVVAGGATLATVAAVVGVSAYLRSEADKVNWGDIEATEADIQAFVKKKMFNVDVETQLNIIDATVTATESARKNVELKTAELFTELNVLKLGVNKEETLNNAAKQMLGESLDGNGGIMKALKDQVEQEKVLLKTTFTVMPLFDENGQNVTSEYLKAGIEGWDLLEKGMTALGTEVSGHLTKAMDEKLSADLREFEQKAAQELLETMARVTQAVSSSNLEAQALSNLTFNLSDINLEDMTGESAQKVIEQFIKYKNELEQGYRQIYTQSAMSYLSMANGLDVLAEDALKKGDEDLYKKYHDAALNARSMYQELIGALDTTVKDAVDQASGQGKDTIMQALAKVYSGKFGDYEEFANIIWARKPEDIADYLKLKITQTLGLTEDQLKTIGIDPYDFMPKNVKTQALTDIANLYGVGIADEIGSAIGAEVPEEVRTSIENAVKEALAEETMQKMLEQQEKEWRRDKDLAEQTAWDKNPRGTTLTTWDQMLEQYRELLDADPVVLPLPDMSNYDDFDLNDYLYDPENDLEISFTVDEESFAQPIPAPDVSGVTNATGNMLRQVTSDVDATVRQLYRLSGLSFSFAGGLGGGGGAGRFGSLMYRANGGFVGNGDLFMAHEAGPELVGRIGSRTAVANNDQIVAGVAGGVAAGQAEQNSLLRQQNDLLRQMLNKSGNVEAVPSAAWGRFIKRSTEMYATNAGT